MMATISGLEMCRSEVILPVSAYALVMSISRDNYFTCLLKPINFVIMLESFGVLELAGLSYLFIIAIPYGPSKVLGRVTRRVI